MIENSDNKFHRKCHNCAGQGTVPIRKRLKKAKITNKGLCYYCGGKGYRTRGYGKDGGERDD